MSVSVQAMGFLLYVTGPDDEDPKEKTTLRLTPGDAETLARELLRLGFGPVEPPPRGRVYPSETS